MAFGDLASLPLACSPMSLIPERLACFRGLIDQGHVVNMSITADAQRLRISVVAQPLADIVMPLLRLHTRQTLDHFTELLSGLSCVDRGHNFSNGVRKVTIWARPPPSVANATGDYAPPGSDGGSPPGDHVHQHDVDGEAHNDVHGVLSVVSPSGSRTPSQRNSRRPLPAPKRPRHATHAALPSILESPSEMMHEDDNAQPVPSHSGSSPAVSPTPDKHLPAEPEDEIHSVMTFYDNLKGDLAAIATKLRPVGVQAYMLFSNPPFSAHDFAQNLLAGNYKSTAPHSLDYASDTVVPGAAQSSQPSHSMDPTISQMLQRKRAELDAELLSSSLRMQLTPTLARSQLRKHSQQLDQLFEEYKSELLAIRQ